MKTKARGHHIYSRCYLKGFTEFREPDSRFNVFLLKDQKVLYNQNLDNFCKRRDFNRIDLEGIDPNLLESELADFENLSNRAIRNVEKTYKFEGEDRIIILNMMVLFALRNVLWRERHDMFINTVMKLKLDIILSAQVGGKVNGVEITPQLKQNLEKFKASIGGENYKINATRNSHIKFELESVNEILPDFFHRKWILAIAPKSSNFITSDRPVVLIWKDAARYATFNPIPPGFASLNSLLIFPLSRDLALIGSFEGSEGVAPINEKIVAEINSYILFFAKEQIYTSHADFYFVKTNSEIVQFKEEYWNEIKRE